MNQPLGKYALIAAALVVVGILENVLWGKDSPGTAHDVSVGFFFLTLAGLVALVVVGATAVVRRLRSSAL